MKLLIVSVVMGLGGAGLLFYGNRYEHRRQEEQAGFRAQAQEVKEANDLIDQITKAKSRVELMALEGRIKAIKSEPLMERVWKMAVAKAVFEDAEAYLAKAIEINNALKLPPEPSPAPPMQVNQYGQPVQQAPPPPSPLHPLVVQNLKEAFKFYAQAKELCDKVQPEQDNADFNFALNYFKGEVYYRHTQFLSTPETAKELFDQTLTYWKHALRYRARDINTVINIELLIKNQSAMLSGAVQPSTQRPQMLPKAGRGGKKGI